MKLEVYAEAGFLRVGTAGKFSLSAARRTFLEILEAIARHKARKVLFDGRGLVGKPETMERFYYGEFAARAIGEFADRGMLSRSTQFGYVLAHPVLDPERFGETVAVNRGMCVRAFDNLPDALEWLAIPPATELDSSAGK